MNLIYSDVSSKHLIIFSRNSLTYLGTIQVLCHQRGGWGQKMAIFDDLQYCKSSKRWVGGPKKVKNMMT
jgi:hypothetical protein